MRAISYIIFISLGFLTNSNAQDSLRLGYEEYRLLVLQNHPASQIGNIILREGEVAGLEARGGFDPKLNADISEKKFKEDPYYSLANTEVEIPTKMGLKVNAGYDRTSGVFLNPENLDPQGGLLFAGVSLPLARGLLFDERRAQLQKAEVIRQSTVVERRTLLNDLLYDAGISYWQWWLSYEKVRIFENASNNARIQFEGVREAAFAGDRAFIDTIEARIQYQNLEQQVEQAKMEFAMSGLFLSTFLWNEEGVPLILNEGVFPDNISSTGNSLIDYTILDNLESILKDHPDMIFLDLKGRELDISKRLAKEYLKPSVDIKYNFLVDAGQSLTRTLSPNNYTWGISMSMPLFFRKEKAKLQFTDLKISENDLDRDIKRNELQNKIGASITKWESYQQQYNIYEGVVADYRSMLEGERALFENGESSQFLINSRQAKYIEAQLKLRELSAGIQIASIETYYSAGVLFVGD